MVTNALWAWIQGKSMFTVKIVKHWNGLPGEVMDGFKIRLDGALSNVIYL